MFSRNRRRRRSADTDPITTAQVAVRWSVHGSPGADVVVAGHSHALAFLHSLDEGRGPTGLTGSVVLDTERRSSSFLDDEYWDLVARASEGKTLCILWNGNQHNAAFLLESNPAFGIYRDGAKNPEGAAWLPRQLLREYWKPSFTELRDALQRLAPIAQVIVVGTPPPKGDEFIRSVIQSDPYFVEQAHHLGMDLSDLRVTGWATRTAMWEILQDMLRECAEEVGATFLPVPAGVADEHGMLLPRYSDPDATHANIDYGELMWSEVLGVVKEMAR